MLLTSPLLFGLLFLSACASSKGARPEEGYPDYNRLEMRKKAPETVPEKPAAPPAPAAPAPTPSSSTPQTVPSDLDAAPKPPPPVVPNKDDSEPVMPEDMLNTLVPGATTQQP